MHTTGVDSIFDVLKHAILPIVTLSIGKIAVYTRYIRANVIKEMKEDYVMTALAKGTSEEKILMRHVLKNCLLPIITLVGMNMGSLVSCLLYTSRNYYGGMKMKKKILTFLLALCLVMALVPMTAFAEENEQNNKTTITTVDDLLKFAKAVDNGEYDDKTDAVSYTHLF